MAELADGTRKVIASTYTLADVVRRGAERARDRKEPVDADEDMPMVEPVPPDYAAFLYARPDGTEVFFESMCRIQRERAL